MTTPCLAALALLVACDARDGEVLADRWPTCRSATCRTGVDCATGECGDNPCAVYPRDPDGVACRTEGDACRVDDDCDWGWAGNWCSPSDGSWSCRLCIDPS